MYRKAPGQQLTRREAFRRGATAAIAVPFVVPAHVLGGNGRAGANDRIHVGVVGCGVRGKYLIGNMPDAARVVALCDCSLDRIAVTRSPSGEFTEPLARFAATDAKNCATHQDYRRMLDRPTFDAVVISAPDHHHALAAVLTCQAGLDVYVEKPLAVTIAEGRAIVNAVKQYDRVVQVGSQQRTMQVNRFACEFIRDGGLGKVSLVQLPNLPGPMRYDGLPAEPVPSSLDWNLFCGATDLRPYHRNLWVKEEYKVGPLLWRGWDLWRAYSGHLMTNWGAHSVDMVQYALGMDASGPVEVWPNTDQLTPELATAWAHKTPPVGTMKDRTADLMRFCPVAMRYTSGTELRFDPSVEEIVFHGERGRLFMSRNKYRTEPVDLAPLPDPREQAKWAGPGHVARPHLENWLDCIHTRKAPNAPIETGHRTATVCHLANIARELGRRLHWDPSAERFIDDQEANRLLSRPRREGFDLPAAVATIDNG